MTGLFIVFVYIVLLALSFFTVAGVVFLISLCFSFITFTWPMAIGVWLILLLLRMAFTNNNKSS